MKESYSRSFLTELYRRLYSIRVFETRCIRLYREQSIRGYLHPYLGEEAIAVGACAALEERDYLVSTHRGHGHCIARGADLDRMTAEMVGKSTGYCKGRGGSMHLADLSAGNLGANGIVGAGIPIGVGAALASKLREEDRVSIVFTSDGASNHGTFGESLNLAAVWDLPVIFIIENNQYAVSTPIEKATREPELWKRGTGYGVESRRIDGNDVLEVYEHTKEAVEACRRGDGPVLLEALTYRHQGHHVNDPGAYMPAEKVAHFREKDPCLIGRSYLISLGGVDPGEVDLLETEITQQMEDAVAFAMKSPEPDVETFMSQIESL